MCIRDRCSGLPTALFVLLLRFVESALQYHLLLIRMSSLKKRVIEFFKGRDNAFENQFLINAQSGEDTSLPFDKHAAALRVLDGPLFVFNDVRYFLRQTLYYIDHVPAGWSLQRIKAEYFHQNLVIARQVHHLPVAARLPLACDGG